jgi:hypothetical protein
VGGSNITLIMGKSNGYPITCHEDAVGRRGIAVLFPELGARWGGWLTPRPGPFTPGKELLYPLHKRPGGSRNQSVRVPKTSSTPGFNP